MYTVSQVKEISGDGTVKMGCLTSACQGCKASFFCNNKDISEFEALNPNNIGIKEGDYAELFMPPGKTVLSAVLVFALPLVLFPLGYLLCSAVWPSANEFLCAIGGFIAMALAFCVSAIVSIHNKRALMPVIIKVVGKADSEK